MQRYFLSGVPLVLGAAAMVFGTSFFGFLASLPPRFFSLPMARSFAVERIGHHPKSVGRPVNVSAIL
jgi:hypothetical protein